jgi:glutamate N-acetyltransferase/amino-acid N-acetyltransferase
VSAPCYKGETEMNVLVGGVTSPKGFTAAGIHCGIRKNTSKKDLALIYSPFECDAAAVFTRNRVKAAPVHLSIKHIQGGKARAIIANSGNANACAPGGEENALRECQALSKELGIPIEEILINSTGVIGVPLPVEPILNAIPVLVQSLDSEGGDDAAHAIMTTDTKVKQVAVKWMCQGHEATIGGMAKGSGMIHPNMGTMFAFLTTDVKIAQPLLQKALSESVEESYNRVSVDGDTSTNDMSAILASAQCGNPGITTQDDDYLEFTKALHTVNIALAKAIAADGEGATKLIICQVQGAKDIETAKTLSSSVIRSPLTKCAMFGADANFGRVLCAMGYSGADFNPLAVDISFSSDEGTISVCREGTGILFDEAIAKQVLSSAEVIIEITLHEGTAQAQAYGCDLGYEYIKINGDYRS